MHILRADVVSFYDVIVDGEGHTITAYVILDANTLQDVQSILAHNCRDVGGMQMYPYALPFP